MTKLNGSKKLDAANDARTVSLLASTRALVIVGAGGFGAIAAGAADNINAATLDHGRSGAWNVIGYADSDIRKRGTQHAGRIVHGTIEEVSRDFHEQKLWFFCAIGDNAARAKMVRLAEKLGWESATLTHPTAILASTAEIGPGCYIGPAAVVSVNAKVGAHSIIDMHASIGHDAATRDFCAVFPGARVTGCCRVGEFAVVGSNATLLPGTIVGDRAVVGANSLARGSVEPDTTVLGVPARVIHKRKTFTYQP
jgi:sugar O-acyltransferase (sialic acid O-acetyltransferase NeuD family)